MPFICPSCHNFFSGPICPRCFRPEQAPCTECGRSYTPEADHDPGMCCICARDLAMEAQFGPEWRSAILAEIVISRTGMLDRLGDPDCPHSHTVAEMRGTRRLVGGDLDDDLHEVVVCTDCGEEI